MQSTSQHKYFQCVIIQWNKHNTGNNSSKPRFWSHIARPLSVLIGNFFLSSWKWCKRIKNPYNIRSIISKVSNRRRHFFVNLEVIWDKNIPKVLIGQYLLSCKTHLKLEIKYLQFFQMLNWLIFNIVRKVYSLTVAWWVDWRYFSFCNIPSLIFSSKF